MFRSSEGRHLAREKTPIHTDFSIAIDIAIESENGKPCK